jgi:RNA polymerase sigma factor (TIGR02999 family)
MTPVVSTVDVERGMPTMQPGEFTQLLQRADQGDGEAAAALFALVEDDLKAIARKRKKLALANLDASTTLLVDEAFLRLVGHDVSSWGPGDRRKFFGYAAAKIHELLVQAARAARRGGGRVDQGSGMITPASDGSPGAALLVELQQALARFERFAPDDALLFRVRYFLGCTFDEAADMLGVPASDAKRTYHRARLWLEHALKEHAIDS